MNGMSIQTLLVNSCLETNLGMPIIYLIFRAMRRYRNEDFSKAEKRVTEERAAVSGGGFADKIKAFFGGKNKAPAPENAEAAVKIDDGTNKGDE